MRKLETLIPENFYLLSNRGINSENIFKELRNYYYFLKQYKIYAEKIAETYAFCLLKNEFKFLVKIKNPELKKIIEINYSDPDKKIINIRNENKYDPSLQFSHFFNSYAQAINKSYNRTGGLFESPFRRELIKDKDDLRNSICKIHLSPQITGLVRDFRYYSFSSYSQIIKGSAGTLTAFKRNCGDEVPYCENAVRVCSLKVGAVLDLFGDLESFIEFHNGLMSCQAKKQP